MDNLYKMMSGLTLKQKKKNPKVKLAPKATKKAANVKKALRRARRGHNLSGEVVRTIEERLLVIMPKIIKKIKSDIKAVKKAGLNEDSIGFLQDNLDVIEHKFELLKAGKYPIKTIDDVNKITEDVLQIIEFTGDYKKPKVEKMAENNAAPAPAAAVEAAIANLSPNGANSNDNLQGLVEQIKKAAI